MASGKRSEVRGPDGVFGTITQDFQPPVIEGLHAKGDSQLKKRSKKKKKKVKTDKPSSEGVLETKETDSKLLYCSSNTSPVSLVASTSEESSRSTFEEELEWCVAQLELGTLKVSASKTQKEDNGRNIRTLQSSKAKLPKKRQLMRNLFGDYRSKMKHEPISVLLQEKSRLEIKNTRLEPAKPKLLETVGTYYKRKTESTKSNAISGLESNSDFKFDFVTS